MHVPFEGPGVIEDWVIQKGHAFTFTRFYEGDDLPALEDVDMLVIMGGPMNVFDFHVHPWMQEEIQWIEALMETGKPLLGICLGAQIIAAALGEEVYPGNEKEIGWHPIQFLPSMGDYKIWNDLPSSRKVFHWHGDTFRIPKGATRIAESQAFPNQGFIYNKQVIALQFHLEVTPLLVKGLIQECGEELVPGSFIQSANQMITEDSWYRPNQALIFQLLDYLYSQIPN